MSSRGRWIDLPTITILIVSAAPQTGRLDRLVQSRKHTKIRVLRFSSSNTDQTWWSASVDIFSLVFLGSHCILNEHKHVDQCGINKCYIVKNWGKSNVDMRILFQNSDSSLWTLHLVVGDVTFGPHAEETPSKVWTTMIKNDEARNASSGWRRPQRRRPSATHEEMDAGDKGKSWNGPKAWGFDKQSKIHATDRQSQLDPWWARVDCLAVIHYWDVILLVYPWNILGI